MSSTTNMGIELIDSSDYISPDPINNGFSKLDALGVDYIVEQGTSGEWWYRKWNSGRAECGIDNKSFGNVDHNNAWGGLYTSNHMSWGAYPFAFKSRPFVSISFNSNSTNTHSSFVVYNSTTSTTTAPKFSIADPNTGTANNAYFSINVSGWYKQDL